MSVLPQGKLDRIVYLEQRVTLWDTNAAAIGLSDPQVAALTTLVTAARAKFNAALAARNASKLATQEQDSALSAMTSVASDMIQTIRLFAQASDEPDVVYDLANIPAPASPTPAGPPPQPTDLSHGCLPDGSVQLKWKGTTSQAAFFKIYRKLTGESAFTSIGAVAAKTLIDDTVPAGTHQAFYYVVGQRGTQMGPASEWLTVNFGVQGESGGEGLALAA